MDKDMEIAEMQAVEDFLHTPECAFLVKAARNQEKPTEASAEASIAVMQKALALTTEGTAAHAKVLSLIAGLETINPATFFLFEDSDEWERTAKLCIAVFVTTADYDGIPAFFIRPMHGALEAAVHVAYHHGYKRGKAEMKSPI